ncbi:pyridoxamine 5'-phosphate oxidase family protein [Actinokineospora baliensis]|uniref:pyridoxamine 5'-phosphate oxidase family protein n=1 Tax=Actinokineospora baliensis TaxID=547056 RepID=UPI001957EF92|nr:pyridoxamine 5'-phosphate oxidase family protein [Actinokineospora baliensis]MBM7774661.1 pyridoxamine 5'-phosphate oxidase family protein [Actinokineospora baliensis]
MTDPAAEVFTLLERGFLDEHDVGRLATTDRVGLPHVVPVAYRRNPDLHTIDVVWRGLAGAPAFAHVDSAGQAAFVVDDIAPPWRVRTLQVRGAAEALRTRAGALIRIRPDRITTSGLDGSPSTRDRTVRISTPRGVRP